MNKDLLIYGDGLMDDALTHWPKNNRSTNIYELDDLLVITVDVAGAEEIKMSVDNGLFKIEANMGYIPNRAKIHLKELLEGKFCRLFVIPKEYNSNKWYSYNCNGILEIQFDKI